MFNKLLRINFFLSIFILVLIDQFIKNAVLAFLSSGMIISDGFLSLKIYKNYGIFFGIPIPNAPFYLAIFLLLLFLSAGRFLDFNRISRFQSIGLVFILAGAAGNTVDRLRFGYIIDYISAGNLLIFNMADAFIVAGMSILLRNLVFKNRNGNL